MADEVRAEQRSGPAVGACVLRPDAEGKVRGEARYADDLAFAGMLHAKVIRSERPHARIVSPDLSEVEAHPGVTCVVTTRDIPGENVVPVIYRDMPLLAADVVRYVGEPIALLAADTREAAESAAGKARVEYVDLPALFDPREASQPGTPQVALPVEAEKGNVFNHMVIRTGDAGQGLAAADIVVEGEYEVGYQEHAYLEPQGVIAVPEDGGMTVYGTLQCPFYVQNAVANVLGLPMAKVRIVQTATGGGFGGKEDVPSHLAAMAAVLAWKARRPVKLVLDRAEDIATTSKRHPGHIRYRTGAKRDGTLTAVEVEFYYNAGAYQTLSSAVLWRGLVHAPGPYRIPHVKVDAYSVATNTVPCGAFRGFGSPQVIFAHESQMDELAQRLGMDPFALREKNALREGDATATGQVLAESVGLGACIEKARDLCRWRDRQTEVAQFNKGERFKRRGLGVSTVMYGVGMGAKAPLLEKAGAYLKLEADGSVTLAVGTTEMGQGATTVLSQIAAEGLGLPVELVQVAPVDSSRVPDSGPTVASRTTTVQGMAVLDAAKKLRTKIEDAVRNMFACPEFTVEGRLFCIPGEPRKVDLSEVARWMWTHNRDMGTTGWVEGSPVDWDAATGQGNAYFVYAYACHVSLVEVDLLTGESHVVGFWTAHDSGKIVNPATARGQVAGGIAQGIGYALTEELASRDGRILAPSFTAYHIPTAPDMPEELEIAFVEAPYSGGPFGAKGLGEVPLMASHAAVANAVSAAAGTRLRVYPAVPERVLNLMAASA